MSLWRTLQNNCGRLHKFNLKGFWGIDLDTKDPQIPNLPILTAASGVQQHTYTAQGVLSSFGAIVKKEVTKTLGGTLSFSGGITNKSIFKTLPGTLSAAGTVDYVFTPNEVEVFTPRRRRQFIPEAVEYVVHHNGPDNIPIIITLDDEGQFPVIVPLLGKDPEQMTYKEFIAYREWQESGRR